MTEKHAWSTSGWLVVAIVTLILVALVTTGYRDWGTLTLTEALTLAAGGIIITFLALCGFVIINPNESAVAQFFGNYSGTIRTVGFRWTNPLYSLTGVSLRIHNFQTEQAKVNDASGNPIVAAAVVAWSVGNTASAVFVVEDYEEFVALQAEAALRNLIARYPYDSDKEDAATLRSGEGIAQELAEEVQVRLKKAGLLVREARISHLAYAPEVAAAMLQRQQATAVVEARKKIVEGVLEITVKAIGELAVSGVTLGAEEKCRLASNLLVVLCGDRGAQPTVDVSRQ